MWVLDRASLIEFDFAARKHYCGEYDGGWKSNSYYCGWNADKKNFTHAFPK